MKVKVTLETTIEVVFDENSKEFKDLFENYNNYFVECDQEDFAQIIAKNVATYGICDNIEGIGMVKREGKMQRDIDHPVSVYVEEGYDLNGMVDFYITDTEINPTEV
ncbi:hypothetical protein PF438_04040 [Elizabethkingia meningoseptica]|uniref:hypothetical protein n=1 Tax=Elizabethkingia meningoseptica TaxID=238 RepID=UPI0022F1AA64|nr:hypothetical protein [Elizabethkingia meningoseptica]EJK5330556.1 hypothetical protein [Elizabethkingia meningoseptica]WBS75662.1 hypothetical protein PF438_04040 [Elizabethkingia meningoseptica]